MFVLRHAKGETWIITAVLSTSILLLRMTLEGGSTCTKAISKFCEDCKASRLGQG